MSLRRIFVALHETYSHIDGRITANGMKEKVLQVVRVWSAWSLFPQPFVNELESTFLHGPPAVQPSTAPAAPAASAAAAPAFNAAAASLRAVAPPPSQPV